MLQLMGNGQHTALTDSCLHDNMLNSLFMIFTKVQEEVR